MRTIYLLTDYQERFGLKSSSIPLKGGFNTDALRAALGDSGWRAELVPCWRAMNLSKCWEEAPFLYTSSEEPGGHYKLFIEDTVRHLELRGARPLPSLDLLRAHDNKVFMEALRNRFLGEELTGLRSLVFGTVEELERAIEEGSISFPCVVKSARGSMSRGVGAAHTPRELRRVARKLARTPAGFAEFRERVRRVKLRETGYRADSRYQGRLVVQPLIEGLQHDWKVLVYGDMYFVTKRSVRKGDFRASGSHHDYAGGVAAEIPELALEMIREVVRRLNVPFLSVDVGFDGSRPFLFEFQAVFFGTTVQSHYSKECLVRSGLTWKPTQNRWTEEEVFAYAVNHFLSR